MVNAFTFTRGHIVLGCAGVIVGTEPSAHALTLGLAFFQGPVWGAVGCREVAGAVAGGCVWIVHGTVSFRHALCVTVVGLTCP